MAGTYEKSAQSGWQTYIRSSKTTGAQNELTKGIYIPQHSMSSTLKHLAHNNLQLLHMNVSGSIWLRLWNMCWFVQDFSFILENLQFWCLFSYNGSKKTTSTKMSCRIVEVEIGHLFATYCELLIFERQYWCSPFEYSSEQDANLLEVGVCICCKTWYCSKKCSKCLTPEYLASGSLAWRWRLWGVVVVFVTFGNEFSFAHRNKIPENNVSKFLHLTYSWRQDSDNCFQDQNSTGETSDVQNLQVVYSDKVEWCVGVMRFFMFSNFSQLDSHNKNCLVSAKTGLKTGPPPV